jgi:site-specific DNA-cytosine methylase
MFTLQRGKQHGVAVSREAYPAARRGREGGADLEIGSEPVSNALRSSGSGSSAGSQVMQPGAATGVRRLTPRECERLQGFPDGWTELDGMSDAARYRMLGNAVAVPCAAWIGRGLVRALRKETVG